MLASMAVAQDGGRLTLNGTVTRIGVPVNNAEVKIFRTDGKLRFAYSNNAGKFRVVLEMDKEYIVSVAEPGSAAATVTVLTEVPADKRGGQFEREVALDLQPIRKDSKGKVKREDSNTGIMFNKGSGEFVTVNRSISKIKEEQALAEEAERKRKEAAERTRLAMLELNRQDSIRRADEERARQAAALTEQDLLAQAAAKEKATADSLAAVEAHLAKIKAKRDKERAEKDSLNKVNEAAKLDALLKSQQEKAAYNARMKAKGDSILAAQAAQKVREQAIKDSLAQAQGDKSKAEQAAKEAERLKQLALKDSAAAVAEAARLREQAVKDSIAKAKYDAKMAELRLKNAGAAKEKAEKDSLALVARQARLEAARAKKAAQDSINQVKEKQRQEALAIKLAADAKKKAEADSIARIKEELRLAQLKLKEEELRRKKIEEDSIATLKSIAKMAEQQRADSIAQAAAEAKALEAEKKAAAQQAYEQQKAEEAAKKQAAADSVAQAKVMAEQRIQAIVDSTNAAKAAEVAARQAQIKADEEARMEAIKQRKEEAERAKQAEIERVREQRKENKVDEEVIEETGKTTYRYKCNIYGVKNTYEKVVHSWGAVYYYKNGAQISDALFTTDLDAARKEVNQ
jgi:hypothetical protein